MAVQVEMWQPLIMEELFASNQFMSHFYNADEYVVGGKVVHIPQSGGPTGVERNRTVYPAAVVVRNDTDITYVLDEFTSNPVRIPNADTVELSYDKTRSVIRENIGQMMDFTATWLLYEAIKNTPAASKIATTGADATATADGATGTRKIITEGDIRAARTLLNKQNVPKNDRYLLLSSEMLAQLESDTNLKYAFQQTLNLKTGELPMLYGFKLMERSTVTTVDNAQAPKVPGSATAVDDSEAAVFWQKDALERALGDVKMFDNYSDPEWFGDLFSFLIRMGGRARRSDNKGYGLIYRAA